MTRILPTNPDHATGKAKTLLDGVKQQMGAVPNIFRTMGQAPAVLDAFLKQSSALAGGSLSAQVREQIALVTAGKNQCDYCASAHTALGSGAGVDQSELADNLRGRSSNATTQAALTFAARIVEKQGRVTDSDLAAVRQAGFSDGELVEIIAVTCMNIFTNYLNHIAGTEIDFPVISTGDLRQAV